MLKSIVMRNRVSINIFTRNALDAPLLAAGRKERSGVATGGSFLCPIRYGSSTWRS